MTVFWAQNYTVRLYHGERSEELFSLIPVKGQGSVKVLGELGFVEMIELRT